jgi:hypothetical protein
VDRHLTHNTARIVWFSVGIVNAANIGIFSAAQHPGRPAPCAPSWCARRRGRECQRARAAVVHGMGEGMSDRHRLHTFAFSPFD